MDAISIVNLFLLLLFGTTVWLLFRDTINKVERIERTTDFLYETLIIENRKPVVKEENKVSPEYEKWDKP
tara:strand:- start:368 stop:577 length:210 start_codon:yes stop_codon:yes gene_type:complete